MLADGSLFMGEKVSDQSIRTPAEPAGVPGLIAIVDDDDQISSALGAWFELCELRTAHHPSGESLLQTLHSEGGVLSVREGEDPSRAVPLLGAVLDLNLTGMNGLELARALRALSGSLPIVIITAIPPHDLAQYGTTPPGVRCLKKPFDLDALEQALSPLFDER
jgi:CheY-like chemotaxis protein